MTQQATPVRPVPRSRLRRLLPLLITAWLVLEIWLLTVVATAVGWFTVLILLVAGVFLGGSLIKRAGLKALSAAVEQSRRPGARQPQSPQPQTGASLTVLAGLLLILPGFLSDLLGLTLLLPPTRALWRAAGRRFARTVLRSTAPAGADAFSDAMRLQEQLRIHRPDGKVIHGEVVDPPAGPTGPNTDYRPPITG
ncbi:FxsA family membrane protein [Kitasatospora sp. GP82]|uniref:FxsA family membrane protein n=1 Tax=Kitasatospora sp. GP82 TaxID=3035089 RepID=UPI002474E8CD|nr:FxsA family membrane protein [Kitasatospora sp. GP82]